MKLISTAFTDGEAIPREFTCSGTGVSPPLQWSEPPVGTQGFALMVEDPDAPDRVFGHWGVYDIPANARQLNTGAAESDRIGLKQTSNDFGESGYGPPCPPKGDKPHHYHFRLIALDVAELPAAPAAVRDIQGKSGGHVLGSAELIGLYGRD